MKANPDLGLTETKAETSQRDTHGTRTKAEIRAERLSWAMWAAGVYNEEQRRAASNLNISATNTATT